MPGEHLEDTPVDNPYRHDHNPLNEDSTGGICPACECEWEYRPQEADSLAWWRSQQ